MRILLAILGCMWLSAEAIKVGVKVNSPFVEENSDGEFQGFIVNLIHRIGELTSDNVTIVASDAAVYGGFDEEGNITGLLGELNAGDYDMVAGPITITEERAKFVDFSESFWSTGLTMLTKRPTKSMLSPGKMFVYFRPFSAAVWVLLILCTIIASILHYVMNKFHPKDAGLVAIAGEALVKKPSLYSEGRRFADACWWICRSFNLQGAESRPKSIAGRVVLVVWIMFVLDSLFLYLATLVNNIPMYYPTPAQQREMGAQMPSLPFTSIDDINVQNKYQFGTVTDSAVASYIAANVADVNGAMTNVASISEGVDKVSNGGYVMFVDDCTAQYYANTDCDMVAVGGMSTEYDYGFAFPKGSQLKATVDSFIAEIRESAKTSHNIWWNVDTLECAAYVPPAEPAKQMPEPYQIEIDSYSGPVVLFIVGQLVALLVAVIEVLVIKRRARSYDVEGAKDPESTPMLEAEQSQAVKYDNEEKEKEEKEEESKEKEEEKEGDDDSIKKEKEAANAEEEKKDDESETKKEEEKETEDNKDIVGADDVKEAESEENKDKE